MKKIVGIFNIKKISLFITVLLTLYLFFIAKRGGDTKHIFSILLMLTIAFQMVITKENKIKIYKYLYLAGIGYIICVGLSYLKTENQINKLPDFLNVVLYTTGFFLLSLNAKFEERVYKNFIPIVTIFSYDAIYRGIIELPLYFKNSEFRLTGGVGPTVYATEIGIYVIIGVFGLIHYKNIKYKIFYILYFLMNFLLMLGTQSRALLVFLPITFIILIIIKKRKEGLLIFCGMLVVGLVAFKNIEKIPFIQRLSSISGIEKIKSDARFIIIEKGIEIEREIFPKNLGFYAYKEGKLTLSPKVEENKKILEIDFGKKYIHFHNVLLELLVTQGILSLIFYLLFNLLIFKELLKKYLEPQKNEQTNIIVSVALGTYIYFTLLGFVEVTFYFEKSSLLIYTILMIAFSEKIKE